MADSSKAPEDEKDSKEKAVEDFLATARKRFQLAAAAEYENRIEAEDDMRFYAGDQWPAEYVQARKASRRPMLKINRLPSFARQITNDQRQNRSSMNSHPVDDKADVETAKKISGLTRHIEYNSNADAAYDGAFESAVRMGWGYYRAVTDFCDPMSFDQEILIKQISNALSVYRDPSSREPDGSDMNWCFIVDDIEVDDYKEQYPDSKCISAEDFNGIGNHMNEWFPGGKIRIAEYYYKEMKDAVLVLLSNNQAYLEEKVLQAENGQLFLMQDDGRLEPQDPSLKIVRKRNTKIPTVMWAKINGGEILEQRETVFDYWIPVFPVFGERIELDGKVVYKGMVRDAKDPQRMLNYWATCETETIALAPKSPFVAAEGQLTGHEKNWNAANTENLPYLLYKPKSLDGVPLPPPQRQVFEPAVAAITNARREAEGDIKGVTGIFDAAMGNRSNETSGKAIRARSQQAQTSNYHFTDNLTRSQRHCGRVLVRAMAKVYDSARVVRIIGEDGTHEPLKINQPTIEKGQEKIYDLSVGKYDVVMDVGPNFATKRQEAAEQMSELAQRYPKLWDIAGDLLVKNLDWPGAQEIMERMRKAMPPGMIDDPNQTPLPPEVKAELDKLNGMIEGLTKNNNALMNEREMKTLELESRERIEMRKAQVELELGMAKMGSSESLALLEAQMREIENRLSLLHDDVPVGAEGPEQQDFQQGGPNGAEPNEEPTGGPTPGQSMENTP